MALSCIFVTSSSSRAVCVLQASRSLRWHFITSLEILTTFPDCPEIALNTSTQPVRSKCECHAKSCNIWSSLDPIYLPTRKMTRRCALEMCAQVKEINLISLSSCPSSHWLMYTQSANSTESIKFYQLQTQKPILQFFSSIKCKFLFQLKFSTKNYTNAKLEL